MMGCTLVLSALLGVVSIALVALVSVLYCNMISIIKIAHKTSVSNSMVPSYNKTSGPALRIETGENYRSELPDRLCLKTALFMLNNINQFYAVILGDKKSRSTVSTKLGYHCDMIYSESSSSPFGCVRAIPDDDLVLVILRGTKGRRERALNMQFETIKPSYPIYGPPESMVKFHAGFLKQYLSVRMQLLYSIVLSGCSRLIISGHSLGAGVSNILLYDLITSGLFVSRDVYVVNFGSPRAGNKAFAKWVSQGGLSLHVIQNTADVFCNLPLSRTPEIKFRFLPTHVRPMFYQYRHAGHLYMFTDVHGVSLMDMHSIKVYENAIKNRSMFESSEI